MKHILKYYLPIFAITLCSIYSCTSTNEGISNTVKMKFHESSIIATDFSDSFNSIKPESATNDAKERASAMLKATHNKVGKIQSVKMGVFQITEPDSTNVSDMGINDTSTIDKKVTAVANVVFKIK